MNAPAVRVDGISKLYRLDSAASKADSFREMLTSVAMSPFRRWNAIRGTARSQQEFWALRDVNFEVTQGEAVGIIGHNGAGKSTLLKVLSRIVEPTSGSATLRGRVASLLEVGTGFHPELSGRENIYLNGSILGMRKREIDSRFEEIVEFAEVKAFLDTPVKRYSSGMYVRLAFSVAAHLEPEILIVDEVLAVGDIQFQKKCLGKMSDVSSSGRTVLFVSHNMSALRQLTQRCVVLKSGSVAFDGSSEQAVEMYSRAAGEGFEQDADLSGWVRPPYDLDRQVEFQSLSFRRPAVFESGEPISIFLRVHARETVADARFSGTVFQADGSPVGSFFSANTFSLAAMEEGVFRADVASLGLAPGLYNFGVGLTKGDEFSGHRDFDIVLGVLPFEVRALQGDSGTIGTWPRSWGAVRVEPPRLSRVSE